MILIDFLAVGFMNLIKMEIEGNWELIQFDDLISCSLNLNKLYNLKDLNCFICKNGIRHYEWVSEAAFSLLCHYLGILERLEHLRL